jgi:citryl-CoA lyase
MPKDEWTTAVGEVAHGTINVRGYPLQDIISTLTFSDAVFLTIRGELPSAAQRRVMDAALCSILEHGFYAPTTLAARMVASASSGSIIPAVAAGVLTIGSITVSPQHTAEIIERVRTSVAGGATPESAVDAIVTEYVESRRRMPGLGHPLHPEGDPRAIALRDVARDNGLWTELSGYYGLVRETYLGRTGRDLPINIDGMLGCVLSELGFTPLEMPGIAAISFMPGIVAHSVEELVAPPTLRVADGAYTGRSLRRLDVSSNGSSSAEA